MNTILPFNCDLIEAYRQMPYYLVTTTLNIPVTDIKTKRNPERLSEINEITGCIIINTVITDLNWDPTGKSLDGNPENNLQVIESKDNHVVLGFGELITSSDRLISNEYGIVPTFSYYNVPGVSNRPGAALEGLTLEDEDLLVRFIYTNQESLRQMIISLVDLYNNFYQTNKIITYTLGPIKEPAINLYNVINLLRELRKHPEINDAVSFELTKLMMQSIDIANFNAEHVANIEEHYLSIYEVAFEYIANNIANSGFIDGYKLIKKRIIDIKSR